MKSWYVYIVRCADETLYTGVTVDPARRLHEHNHSPAGARYTRSRRPVELVYQEQCESRAAACSREAQLKQLRREDKQRLFQ